MKITKITKRIGRVIPTGNYASLRVEAEVEAQVSETDDLKEVDQVLFNQVSDLLAADLTRIKKRRDAHGST